MYKSPESGQKGDRDDRSSANEKTKPHYYQNNENIKNNIPLNEIAEDGNDPVRHKGEQKQDCHYLEVADIISFEKQIHPTEEIDTGFTEILNHLRF